MEKTYIDILKPDDWHVHLREGQILSTVLPLPIIALPQHL